MRNVIQEILRNTVIFWEFDPAYGKGRIMVDCSRTRGGVTTIKNDGLVGVPRQIPYMMETKGILQYCLISLLRCLGEDE